MYKKFSYTNNYDNQIITKSKFLIPLPPAHKNTHGLNLGSTVKYKIRNFSNFANKNTNISTLFSHFLKYLFNIYETS